MRRHQPPRSASRQTAERVNQPILRNPLQTSAACAALVVVCVTLANGVWGGPVEEGATVLDWQRATDSPPWARRYEHTSHSFKGRLFVLGGELITPPPFLSSVRHNDIWSSADGINWSLEATGLGGTYGQRAFASVVYGDELWTVGGEGDTDNHDAVVTFGEKNDVWVYREGVGWNLRANSTDWEPRMDHAATVHDGMVWLMGGDRDAPGLLRDIWASEDGEDWLLINAVPPWQSRRNHSAATFDGKIWVLGGWGEGAFPRGVWYSEDGLTWK